MINKLAAIALVFFLSGCNGSSTDATSSETSHSSDSSDGHPVVTFSGGGGSSFPPTLGFNNVSVYWDSVPIGGTPSDKYITVTNNGATTVTGLTLNTVGAFSRGGGTCGATLNPGLSCTLGVKFNPVNRQRGMQASLLTFSYDNGSSQSVGINAIGWSPISEPYQVVTQGNRTCVVYNDGSVKCAGVTSNQVTSMSGAPFATTLSMGNSGGCVITDSRKVYCFGDFYTGSSLGLSAGGASTYHYANFTQISSIANASQIAVGDGNFCATDASGHINCFGQDSGSLGTTIGYNQINGGSTLDLTQIVTGQSVFTGYGIGGLTGEFSLSMSPTSDHACFVTPTGNVNCWGADNYLQLGDSQNPAHLGSTTPYNPGYLVRQTTLAANLGHVLKVASGNNHSCALIDRRATLNGVSIYCWGNDVQATGNYISAGVLTGAYVAVDVAVGDNTDCAVLDNGKVACWGDNASGELGNGVYTNSVNPVFVSNLVNAQQVSVGSSHACAIATDVIDTMANSVYCWGANNNGQLATNDTTPDNEPVATQF